MSQPSQRELIDRALAALTVYAQRGRNALSTFADNGDAEAFLEALKQRDVAFHNFCALEELVTRAGADFARDPGAQALWPELQDLNATLADLMARALEQLSHKITKVRIGKATAQAYRSGSASAPRLIKLA